MIAIILALISGLLLGFLLGLRRAQANLASEADKLSIKLNEALAEAGRYREKIASLETQIKNFETLCAKSQHDLQTATAKFEDTLIDSSRHREKSTSLETQIKGLETLLSKSQDEQQKTVMKLDTALVDANNLREKIVSLETEARQTAIQQQEKIDLLLKAREEMSTQFKLLAQSILEEKSSRFAEQNQNNLNQMLEPLKEKILLFQGKIEALHIQEGKDRATFAEQLRQLTGLNQQLSQDAKDLTQALKGSSKTQGNWGEMILEKVLEASGLRRDQEYRTQENHQRADGSRAQPDVIVYLPENRHLIIDAKVSLTAYEQAVQANEEQGRQKALKQHLESVRAHIRLLSEKNYSSLPNIHSLDFVLMFIPLEPAYMAAISQDIGLWQEAWNKNILLVCPSTLLFVVRTVAHLWKQERQNQNTLEIAKRGAELYDKFVGFVEDMNQLGQRLEQAQKSFDGCMGKLSQGRGNLVGQAEKLKALGLNPSKNLNGRISLNED